MKTNRNIEDHRLHFRNLRRAAIVGAVTLSLLGGVARAADIGVNISIREGPPPPRHEVIVPRPSPRHVWVAGYWGWRHGHHEWIAGHWEIPPRGRRVWVEPRWERRGDHYVFIEGRWR